MQTSERNILIGTSAAHYLSHFYILVFPALVMPISRELSLSPDQIISLSFPMYMCYGLMAIPCGYLSDRFSPGLVMGAGVLLAGVGFIAAGMAQSVAQLTAFFGLVGVGCSAYHPSGLALVSKGISQRGRALGINGVCGNLGIASAPLLAGILCWRAGWHAALLILGGAGIAAGLLLIMVPLKVSKQSDLQQGTTVEKRKALLIFALMCGAMLFSGLLYRGFTIILPTFLESRLTGVIAELKDQLTSLFALSGMRDNTYTLVATGITSLAYIIGMAGQLLGGRIADRYDLRWGYLIFFCCAFPFLAVLGAAESFYLVIPAGLFAFFSFGMQPIENSLVAMLTPPQWRSVSYGIKFTIVFGAGSIAVKLVSMVQSKYGLDQVIVLLAVFLVMVILMIALLLLCSRGETIRHEKVGTAKSN